jgi:hypothetical protein
MHNHWYDISCFLRLSALPFSDQCCQMFYFQAQNTNLGKFWRASDWKVFVYFKAIWNIYGHLGYSMTVWYSLC